MPQLQLPIFSAGSKNLTDEISVEYRDNKVIYSHGMMPMFQHGKDDLRAFRMFTSQLIDMGSVKQANIVETFGVPLSTVKRYLHLLRTEGPEAFFAEPKVRAESVVKGEAREIAERMLQEGVAVPEVAKATGILANTLHKAIRAKRLPAVKKKRQFPARA
jgi:hypothetical protein